MANVLCQIHGLKRIALYPPSDVSLFNLAPGASSSSMNVLDDDALVEYPCLKNAHPQECILKPGEVLYIPPFWLHTAVPVEKVSISINVFFRSLKSGYAAGRDIYGNRDLQAYENGRKDIRKICKAFDGFPREIRKFYLERLANELTQQAQFHTT
jgi:tRNA wybutosine-synthesizing protein 4